MSRRTEVFQGTDRFSVVRLVGTGGMGVVYEVFDRERRQAVALKTLRNLDATSLYRFKHEFRALADVVHPNLIPLYELFADDQHWYFTMELIEHATDFLSYLRQGGDDSDPSSETETHTALHASAIGLPAPAMAPPAHDVAAPAPGAPVGADAPVVDMDRLRHVLRQLVDGVAALHDAGKLHRDLKPRNVIVRRDGRVVVLDLGLVADLSQGHQERGSSGSGSGSSGPSSDSRSYHSTDRKFAGTIAYMSPEQAARAPLTPASDWYAVGVMLFQALTGRLPFDGLAAQVLRDKQQLDAPRASDLVMGLPDDLATICEHLLRRDPTTRPTGPDLLARLGVRLPTSPIRVAGQTVDDVPFVGRTSQLQALAEAFDAMLAGRPVVCRVHGRSGQGKSTLIARFLMDIAEQRDAVVLTGRCYEQESVPYKAVDSLVDALTRYLMTLGREELDLLTPPHTAALTRMFPVLERVPSFRARDESATSPADPRETRRLASEALRAILAGIGRQRPLVLYVDDVQWGDADSALLVRELLGGDLAPRVLVLLAYRSEYTASSPFLRTIDPSGEAGGDRVVTVEPLSPDEAQRLARTLLGDREGDVDAEAAWVAQQSGGSALFVHELVEHLKRGAAVGQRAADLDTVLWERVQGLPEATRRLVEVVAVAGRPVRLHDAQAAAHLPALPPETMTALRTGRYVRTMRLDARHDEVEMFHDRIRESVVAHLPPDVLRHHHKGLAVALELAGQADPETLAAHLEGAGDTARAGHFYARAAEDAARVLAFGRAEALFARAAALVSEPQERARIHERMIHFLTDTAHFTRAYDVCREAVAAFGVRLPARFVPPLFAIDFVRARWRLRGRAPATLVDLPLMTDARLETAVRLMSAGAKAAYQVRPELCVAVATRSVNLCLTHGNTPDCAIGYMVFGAIFQGGVLANHRAGYEFGRLALDLVERYGNARQRAEVNFVVGYFGTSWLRPATEAEALWRTAFEAGLETGDLFHTGCACAGTIMSYHMRGVPLDETWQASERMLDVLERARLEEPAGVVRTTRQVIRNLQGLTDSPGTLSDAGFDEDAFVASLDGYGSRHFAHWYFIARMQVAYLRGDYAHAAALARRSAACLKDSPGMLHAAEHHFQAALIDTARGHASRATRRAAGRFARWAAQCPDNFAHKASILQGELARVRGRTQAALDAFEAARASAREHGYLQVEALADDLAARVHDARGDAALRDAARMRAAETYARWGVK